jgi:hypothetical protein
MLSDLITALELLIQGVSRLKSPELKRRKIAKLMLKILLDLDELLDRGKGLVSILSGDFVTSKSVALQTLTTQQRVLQDIVDNLNAPQIKSLFAVYLPDFNNMVCHIISHKLGRVVFYISQLIETTENISIDTPFLVPQKGRPLNQLPFNPMVQSNGNEEYMVEILASQQEIKAAKIALKQLSSLQRQLRELLKEKFEFDDILQ